MIDTGKAVANLPCVLGVDDLWFDASRNRLCATGSGLIGVFRQHDPDHYSLLSSIPVGGGSGSTRLRLKTRTQDSLYYSWLNTLPQGGSGVLLFYVND